MEKIKVVFKLQLAFEEHGATERLCSGKSIYNYSQPFAYTDSQPPVDS